MNGRGCGRDGFIVLIVFIRLEPAHYGFSCAPVRWSVTRGRRKYIYIDIANTHTFGFRWIPADPGPRIGREQRVYNPETLEISVPERRQSEVVGKPPSLTPAGKRRERVQLAQYTRMHIIYNDTYYNTNTNNT